MMSGWSLEMDSWPVVSSGFIQGLGMGLVFMPLNALAFATLDQRYRTDGSSLLNLMRSIGQSAGISMVTVFLARNIQTSHSDLAQHVTDKTLPGFNLGQLDQFGVLSDAIIGDGRRDDQQTGRDDRLYRRFLSDGWITLLVLPLVLLLQSPKKSWRSCTPNRRSAQSARQRTRRPAPFRAIAARRRVARPRPACRR